MSGPSIRYWCPGPAPGRCGGRRKVTGRTEHGWWSRPRTPDVVDNKPVNCLAGLPDRGTVRQERGMHRPHRIEAPAGGLVATVLDPPGRGLALGLDVGGTQLAAGLVSAAGEVCAFAAVPTMAADGPQRVVPRLC